MGRTPDATGLSYWLNKLQQGADPSSIAYGFAASAEREGQRVVADYQGYLGRSPSAAEVNAWVDLFINHGQTNEKVIAGFIASQEYYQNHYSDARDWLFAAYRATLGRDPDSAGLRRERHKDNAQVRRSARPSLAAKWASSCLAWTTGQTGPRQGEDHRRQLTRKK